MERNKPDHDLEDEEINDIIAQENYISNYDEIAVGTNDIIDRETYLPGDKEIVNEIADEIGLADYSPAADIVAQMINAVDYNEEILEEAENKNNNPEE